MSGTQTPDPLALESQVCFALTLASRNIVSLYKPILEPLNLTHPQYLVMLALWQSAPLSIKNLSSLLRLDPATLSPLTKRLEALGYIARARSVEDERTLAIVLTPQGYQLRELAEQIPSKIMERLNMNYEELNALHSTMLKLIDISHDSTI